jgi:hypothetical protein
MREYKDKRYGGRWGALKWGKDKLFGLPEEANQIFVEARDHYVTQMRRVISNVADTIGRELGRAKARIAKGKADLQAEVKRLPADLQAIGKQAAADFADKFDELTQSVDDKGTELVDTLATKYTDALKSVDEEIAAEKEKNKGLVDKVVDAVKGVIKTIMELKNLLLGVLRKAAQAIGAILKDPIGFLRNLVSAVGAGLKQFMKNIGKHLQQGLVSWLLGTAAKAGIQLPAKFDIKGILLLIASLLGLTWAAIRSRIVRKVPEQAVAAAEKAVPLAAKVKREGVGGLWDDLKDRIGDLKSTLISKVTEFLVPTIIIAGIMWVLSLLNPASAFVRACKLIIDIVRFIVERGRQVLEFVNAVLDAVIAIAKGGGGGAPALVENALARSIPVLIGFLAALLGIGGIADKVKKIFQALSKPVMKAIDWVINKIVGLVKKLWVKLKRLFDKKKPKKTRTRVSDGDDSAADVQRRWREGIAAIQHVADRARGRGLAPRQLEVGLAAIKNKYRFQEIYAYWSGSGWRVFARLNPNNRDRLISMPGKVLLVGEGNLSFTGAILVLGIVVPSNVTATVHESTSQASEETRNRADELITDHPGVTVEFNVDATRLHEGRPSRPTQFDTIVWQFPNLGALSGEGDLPALTAADRLEYWADIHHNLLLAFFGSASRRLSDGGTIVVTLSASPMYRRWGILKAAKAAGLTRISTSGFEPSDYPGYRHQATEPGARARLDRGGITHVFRKS